MDVSWLIYTFLQTFASLMKSILMMMNFKHTKIRKIPLEIEIIPNHFLYSFRHTQRFIVKKKNNSQFQFSHLKTPLPSCLRSESILLIPIRDLRNSKTFIYAFKFHGKSHLLVCSLLCKSNWINIGHQFTAFTTFTKNTGLCLVDEWILISRI